MTAGERIEPFRIAVWSERETGSDWSQGVPLDTFRS